ncbi:uncharacterized protein LOC141852959 [Brevipalpus obovatus]|uniref:uncharacterized protein LOC141852959 n=1 Tax=Brevipalpus obovatus TaxID=246614 RepID=UPI003D9ED2B8
MGKKKKQGTDFQKVKLKVGRKLTKGGNVTKTEFKSKRIVLREVRDLEENPLISLTRNPTANTKYKLVCLNKLKDHLGSSPHQVTGETINTLAKMLLDDDERVRCLATKNLKNYLESMRSSGMDVSPFFTIVLTYLKCAITHLSSGVSGDAKDLLQYLIPKCDTKLYKMLMITILARLSITSQPTAKDLELAALVAETTTNTPSQASKFVPQQFKWSESNNCIDLSALRTREPRFNHNISFQLTEEHDVAGKFTETIRALVKKEFDYFQKKKRNHLTIDPIEARKLMAYLRMAKFVGSSYENIRKKLAQISIAQEMNHKPNKKEQSEINMVRNKFESMIKSL